MLTKLERNDDYAGDSSRAEVESTLCGKSFGTASKTDTVRLLFVGPIGDTSALRRAICGICILEPQRTTAFNPIMT